MTSGAREPARLLPPPIYLHFLDRELGDAFEFALSLATAQRAFAALSLGTACPLACSMSNLFENDGLRRGVGMVEDLVRADVLLPHSTHSTSTEFLESRRTMYEHDQARYPRYFGSTPLGALAKIEPRLARGSTTAQLHERMVAWTEGESTIPTPGHRLPHEAAGRMMGAVGQELGRREGRAVTYAMFRGVVGTDLSGPLLERTVRQRISLEYTDHQRGEHARLATGIALATERVEVALEPDWAFERDVPILAAVIEAAGLGPLLQGWPRALWQPILARRGRPEHIRFVSRIQLLARALDSATPASGTRADRRQRAIAAIRGATEATELPMDDAETMLIGAQANLDLVATTMSGRGLGPYLARFADAMEPLKADVLLIVATDVEQRETLRELGFPPGKSPRRHPRGQQILLELDVVWGQRVFLVRSEMGSGGSGGSQFTADDAIAALHPTWVIMAGIAFGVDPAKQSIGDVLVPTEVVLYDHKRVGTADDGGLDIAFRAAPGLPDAALLKRIRAAALDFGGAEVRFGKLLSGSELVDNEQHRRELVEAAAHGKAIGGEMELHGVFAAASRRTTRWIAAKAICDFADGRKSVDKAARQELAAANAARLVHHVIKQGLLGSPD